MNRRSNATSYWCRLYIRDGGGEWHGVASRHGNVLRVPTVRDEAVLGAQIGAQVLVPDVAVGALQATQIVVDDHPLVHPVGRAVYANRLDTADYLMPHRDRRHP